jgi:single-stranded-DNA-specific exonuclease
MPEGDELPAELIAAADNSPLLARLLFNRGVCTAEQAEAYLQPEKWQVSSPMAFGDAPRAVARINQAIERGEHITVYGDYDVDGITATCVMLTVLKKLGARTDFYIPNRASEGYGLNLKAVSVMASKHRTKLIITCDCGISNFAEINFAKSLGVDCIVLDHHALPDMTPPAVAIMHPKHLQEDHPLLELSGVGVAYKLAEALLLEHDMPDEIEQLLDLVTLGLIADMVPLVRENRYLVQTGMPKLIASSRPGIKALLALSGHREGTDLVGFGLAPRLNAAGRLSDATTAVELLTTDDEQRAQEIAKSLELENARRQELCEQVFFEADRVVSQTANLAVDRAIAIYSKGWHHGVVGIVASRLVEKYSVPVFIGEWDEAEKTVKGSARGVSAIDLHHVLKLNEHLAQKWGGHKAAAGFTVEIEKVDLFCRAIVDTCTRLLQGQPRKAALEIDCVLEPRDVNQSLARSLSCLSPFGIGNRKPIFAAQDLQCVSTRVLGKEGKHHRIVVAGGTDEFECVFWNSRGRIPPIGNEVDIAFSPEINTYNGVDRLQLVLSDWRDASMRADEEEHGEEIDMRPDGAQPAAATAEPGVAAAPPADGIPTQASTGTNPVAVDADDPELTPTVAMPVVLAATDAQSGREAVSGAAAATEAAHSDAISAANPDAVSVMNHDAAPVTAEALAAKSAGDASFNQGISAAQNRIVSRQITWKDLRDHLDARSLLDAAIRKLGDKVALFAETSEKLGNYTFSSRCDVVGQTHLILWQYPPSIQVLRSLIRKSAVQHVYLIGALNSETPDATAILRKLLALVKYAVNHKDGQADPDRLAQAMAVDKMSVALALTILKKIHAIDWFAEDGTLFVDLLEQPEGNPEDLPEFRQLSSGLAQIAEFRRWCAHTDLSEIQLAVVPNALELQAPAATAPQAAPIAAKVESEV